MKGHGEAKLIFFHVLGERDETELVDYIANVGPERVAVKVATRSPQLVDVLVKVAPVPDVAPESFFVASYIKPYLATRDAERLRTAVQAATDLVAYQLEIA